jgi:hypothetical protein
MSMVLECRFLTKPATREWYLNTGFLRTSYTGMVLEYRFLTKPATREWYSNAGFLRNQLHGNGTRMPVSYETSYTSMVTQIPVSYETSYTRIELE